MENNKLPLVSVIIPTFGSNTNPCRAIDSVFSQSYHAVEVVVVDDNGLDTPQQKHNCDLFKKYCENKYFKYIVHKSNLNGSVARNTGVLNSHGDYLCFLDDDDFFSDQYKIEKQIKASILLDDSYAGTFSSLRIFRQSSTKPQIVKANDKGNVLIKFIKSKMSIGTAAPIITRRSFEEIGGFRESFSHHQDWEFFARLLDKYKLKAVPTAFYDRCYKTIPKRDLSVRKQRMDKYVELMKTEISSLSKKTINKLMKEKYYPLYFASFRDHQKEIRKDINRQNRFTICDYTKLGLFAFVYFFNRIFNR